MFNNTSLDFISGVKTWTFWKKIVNIQGLLVSMNFHPCCFYIQYHGGIREITCQYGYFVLYYILYC